MLEKILAYIHTLDLAPQTPLKETDISQGIKTALGPTDEKATGESLYEILAFDFFPRHEGHISEWGTHFGSVMSGHTENPDESWEYPSRKQIDEKAIDYWTKRAQEALHPIVIERYADVAFDLATLINKKGDYTLAQLVIGNGVKICEENLVEDICQRQQLHRALSLALQLNDTQRIAMVADAIIRVEKKITQDDKPGLWGFAFKWLVLSNSEKVKLEESVVNSLVQDLEDRLNRFTKAIDPDPWHVENIVILLVPYYLSKKDENNAARILLILEDAFRKNIHANSDPLLKVHYLEQLDALYRQYSALPGVREHLNAIANELPTASKESLSSFKEVSGEIKIETEKIRKITDDIFTIPVKGNTPTLSDIRIRIVSNFIGKKKDAAKLAEELSKKFVFMHIMPQRRVAEDGHTEAILPPYEEDPDSHAISQAFQNIQLTNIFLSDTLLRLREKFPVEEVMNLIMESGIFFTDEKDYLMKGLQAYWTNDPFNASHTFIPYIETLIRRLISKAGGITITPNTKPGTYGGYSYKTLGLLLNENAQLIDDIYKIPVTFYLELLLVHPLGWNLRNNFAHGASLASLFRQDIADRLFHILLLLSLIREEKK